jgi:hypothetical protein
MNITKRVSHKWRIKINEEANKFKVPFNKGRSFAFVFTRKWKLDSEEQEVCRSEAAETKFLQVLRM